MYAAIWLNLPMTDPYLIKKYANRRLYDTVESQHVTLSGIRDLILRGCNVKIVDDTNNEDITRSLLLQIIAEQEQGDKPLLDAEFLMRIIRLYGNPMQDLMGEFLLKSFDAFVNQQAQFEEQLRQAMTATPLATIQELAAKNIEAWQKMQDALMGKKSGSDKDEEQE